MTSPLHPKHALLLRATGDSPTTRAIMNVLTAAHEIDTACHEFLASHGLSEARFAVLLAVSEDPGISPASLADHLAVTRATVTGLIKSLTNDELIERQADDGDGRSTRLFVTPNANSALTTLIPWYREWIAHFSSPFTTETARHLDSALTTLRERVRTSPTPPPKR